MKFEIKHRYSNEVLFSIEIGSLKLAVEAAVKSGANLTGANLTGASLTGASLTGADLRRADLTGASLTGANLTDANLTSADLTSADLTSADLTSAYLTDANLRGANLTDANLTDANLTGANLRGANLTDANLTDAKNFRLPTGESWQEYVTETVPALLTAGGKSIESFMSHWECHSWSNCPMAHAFNAQSLDAVPLLLRPRAEQFIQFFDAKLIPWPLPKKDDPYFTAEAAK